MTPRAVSHSSRVVSPSRSLGSKPLTLHEPVKLVGRTHQKHYLKKMDSGRQRCETYTVRAIMCTSTHI